jgi:hypothetical protein
MSRALPVFTEPALNVNVESRILTWQSAFCGRSSRINNAMAGNLINLKPLNDNIFQRVSYFFARW